MESKVGGAKAEPSSRQAEMERSYPRPEAEPIDPFARALLVVVRPKARNYGRASPEVAKGCKFPAAMGLEDWLSSVAIEVTRD